MTTRTTFTSIADGDQLNQGYFNGIYENFPLLTDKVDQTGYSTTSSSFQTATTLTTPTARKASQVILVEAWVNAARNLADGGEIRLVDTTGSAVIGVVNSMAAGSTNLLTQSYMLAGSATITTAGSANSIRIEYRRSSGSSDSIYIGNVYMRASILPQ